MSNTRKIAAFVLIVAIAALSYFFYIRRQEPQFLDLTGDGLGGERNENRDYTYLIAGGSTISLLSEFTSSGFSLDNHKYKPLLLSSDSAFNASNRSQNAENARWLVQNLDPIVSVVAKSVRLPRCLIYLVLLVETGSVARRAKWNKAEYDRLVSLNPSGAVGPAQVKPITATETIQIALNKGLLADYHVNVVQDTIGWERANTIFVRESAKSRYFKDNKVIGYDGQSQELLDDRLNIMIAALKLVNLIDNYGEDNLHQVYYSYNQGDRTVIARGLRTVTDINDFIAKTSGEGQKYVKRAFSKDGALDIIINDLNIFQ